MTPGEQEGQSKSSKEIAYDLRLHTNRAVSHLRQAEDIARLEMPAWPTADRIRSIYEQITADLLNGRMSVPPIQQRLDEAEKKLTEQASAVQGERTLVEALLRALWELDLSDEHTLTEAKPRELVSCTRPVEVWRKLQAAHDVLAVALLAAPFRPNPEENDA